MSNIYLSMLISKHGLTYAQAKSVICMIKNGLTESKAISKVKKSK